MDYGDNKRAIITGIFLTLGLIIFVVGVFTLGGSQKAFSKNIHVTTVFSDVNGLKPGNNVWFSGVKIGTISDMRFTGISRVNVKLTIDQDAQPFIHRDAEVHIGSDGLIGNRIIVIDGGTPQAPRVEEGDTLHAQKLMSSDDIMKTLQKNNENLLSITQDFKQVSHRILQGKGTVGALLADSSMGQQLKTSMRNLQTTTQSAVQLAAQIDAFSRKLNTRGGLADNLFTDTTTFNRIKLAAAQLQKATTNASATVDNLNSATRRLNSTDNALGVLLNDPKGAEQMRTTLRNLQQSSVKLNDDLEAAQHNFLLKGFFKKRAQARQDSLKANQ